MRRGDVMDSNDHNIYNFIELLTDNIIYIVGFLKLQNALMSSLIEKKTGMKCLVVDSLSNIPDTTNENTGHSQLALLDFFGKDLGNILHELDRNIEKIPSQCVLGIFNVRPGEQIEEETVAIGIRGYFYENDSLDQLLKGIHAIFAGELWVSRKVMTEYILNEANLNCSPIINNNNLTPRQKEILAMIATGATNDMVADKLHISTHTVKTHVYNIFKEINVTNRLQAALWAANNL